MWTDSRSWYTKMFIMQNAAIEMHWLMVNHVSRLKKAEKPKMLVWRTEFGRGVFFGGKLNKPCGYWFCQKWLLIISKRPKKSSEWCYFNLTPPTDHGYILRRSPLKHIALLLFLQAFQPNFPKVFIPFCNKKGNGRHDLRPKIVYEIMKLCLENCFMNIFCSCFVFF